MDDLLRPERGQEPDSPQKDEILTDRGLQRAHEDDRFVPVNDPDADWEHNGIVVDIEAPALWFEVTLETDPAVLAALEVLDGE